MSLTKVSGDLLESPLTIPSGSSIVIESGATITNNGTATGFGTTSACLLYTSPSPRDAHESRMPSSA